MTTWQRGHDRPLPSSQAVRLRYVTHIIDREALEKAVQELGKIDLTEKHSWDGEH